jgi:uncharacterized protein (TIGR02145 family)
LKKQLLSITGLLFYTFFCNLYSQNNGTSLDQDSNSFEWIKYGDQYWSVVNAEVETYRDGTPIPYIEDQTVWKDLTIGAWCYYKNDSTDDKIYGKLYNWYAVAGIFDEASLNDASLRKEFAPTGFRVPNNDDWNEFYQYMISAGFNFDSSTDGNKLAKSLASVQLWNSSEVDGSPGLNKESNNSSLFKAIPVGVRAGCCFTDYFGSRGVQTYFWSKNEHDQNNSVCAYINFEDYKSNFQNNFKTDGYSVRFVSSEKPVSNSNILLNGTVSAENNQIKNVADPTDDQDVVTKNYLVASQSNTYSQQQVDQIISNLQEQINTLKAQSVNYGSNTFSSVIEVQNSLKPKEQIFTIFDNTVSNTIQGTNGTVIYINPNAITLNGSPYTGVVKATLDEYLTPNSMILSGIQTTSNGELLVTGGSFELDLEGEFGEDLDLANWSTSASMPLAVNLSNDFKSAMRFYVGERLQIDGREQVNWELNDFQEFGPPWQGFSEFYGINLGLSNCDVLYSSVIQGLGTQFSVLLEGVSDYNNAIVWMFINDFPSVVQITSLIENEQGFKTYADSIPVGLNATLLAIYVDEDDYLKFGTLEINVQGDDVFTIPLSFGTKDSLKALIESL